MAVLPQVQARHLPHPGLLQVVGIRRAYVEVRTAARLIQRYGRTYLAYRKFQDMKESDDPALTKDKKREILLKILYPNKYGAGRIGLSGKRRRVQLQPVRVKGDDDGEADDGDDDAAIAGPKKVERSSQRALSVAHRFSSPSSTCRSLSTRRAPAEGRFLASSTPPARPGPI